VNVQLYVIRAFPVMESKNVILLFLYKVLLNFKALCVLLSWLDNMCIDLVFIYISGIETYCCACGAVF
jgi:hypothetical protein